MKLADFLASAFGIASMRVQALDRRHILQRAGAAMIGDFELQPRNVPAGRTRRASRAFRNHCAPFNFPVRTRVMAANDLAVLEQRGDRLAELPRELAAWIRLALVNLCAFGVHLKHDVSPFAAIVSGTSAPAATGHKAAASEAKPASTTDFIMFLQIFLYRA